RFRQPDDTATVGNALVYNLHTAVVAIKSYGGVQLTYVQSQMCQYRAHGYTLLMSYAWNNWQCHVRGVRAVVVNRLDRWQQCGLCGQYPTRIGITVKAWEIAARNLQTDAMTGLKDIARGP